MKLFFTDIVEFNKNVKLTKPQPKYINNSSTKRYSRVGLTNYARPINKFGVRTPNSFISVDSGGVNPINDLKYSQGMKRPYVDNSNKLFGVKKPILNHSHNEEYILRNNNEKLQTKIGTDYFTNTKTKKTRIRQRKKYKVGSQPTTNVTKTLTDNVKPTKLNKYLIGTGAVTGVAALGGLGYLGYKKLTNKKRR